MKTIRWTAATLRRIGALYREWIGYDPFEDDPSINPMEVLETLREYRREGWHLC